MRSRRRAESPGAPPGYRMAARLLWLAAFCAGAAERQRFHEEWCAAVWQELERGHRWQRSRIAWHLLGAFVAALTVRFASPGDGRQTPPPPPPRAPSAGVHETMIQDLRYAFRALRKSPGFVAVVLLTLALGLGANTAMFSIVDTVLLRPLPIPEAERLAIVWGYHPEIGTESASLPDFADWRSQNRSFETLVAMFGQNLTISGGDAPERVRGARVTHGFFETMGARPEAGRFLLAEEDSPDTEPVVVLSHRFWRRRFGGDRGVVGDSVLLQGVPTTVVGVAGPGLDFPRGTEVWRPLAMTVDPNLRRSDFLHVLGRLRPGVTAEGAEQEMVTIMARLEQQYPVSNTDWSARVVPLRDEMVGNVRPALWTLMGAVGFVLLIACANVANLLLVRATGRRSELALRMALGASRLRLFRQLLTESLLLAICGGLLGLALARGLVAALVLVGPTDLPRLEAVTLDGGVLAFSALAALVTGLVFGGLPALRLSRGTLPRFLAHGSQRSGGRVATGSLLVVAQMALALVLLVGAGLLLRSLESLQRVDPGFHIEGLATAGVSLPASAYPEEAQVVAFYDHLLESSAARPGVIAAAAVSSVPLRDGVPYLTFAIEGEPPPDNSTIQDAQIVVVTPGYFEVLGIPLLAGRRIERHDRADTEAVAMVNQTLARTYFDGGQALGRRLTMDGTSFMRIVGVVGDTRHSELSGEPYAQIYLPHSQNVRRSMKVVMGTEGEPGPHLAALRRDAARLDRNLPLYDVATLRQVVGDALAQPRFGSQLLSLFALAALLLSATGLYGVLSYVVAQRAREIGIRMALGARRAQVMLAITRRGAALLGAGLAVGLVLAAGLSRLLRSLLFATSPLDPVTFLIVPVVMTSAALLATWLPAARASRVDPVIALRED